ncbi:MAG: permease [Pseudomonadota bacterium]
MHDVIERRWLLLAVTAFVALWLLPGERITALDWTVLGNAMGEGVALLHDYAREHVILCLVPAFLIAGAMAVYVSKSAVLRLMGPDANRATALGVGSVAGGLLAVCSCTVLPLFAGLYKRGAGIGPATAFLFTGPAINVIAVLLTAKVLGVQLGFARAVAAVVLAVVIGLVMAWLYRHERTEAGGLAAMPDDTRPVAPTLALFGAFFAVLVFANWAGVDAETSGVWAAIHELKWWLVGAFAAFGGFVLVQFYGWPVKPLLWVAAVGILGAVAFPAEPQIAFALAMTALVLVAWRTNDDARDWMDESWGFAKLILPLLLVGVFVAGVLLGRPGEAGLIPETWIAAAVGGESLRANLFASVVGSLMYFATLTEVPIVEGLRAAGMGEGPALTLLLAGPALSLPNMLAIRSVLGTQKTAVYVALVVVLSTTAGLIYGNMIV